MSAALTPLTCLACGDEGGVDIVLNVLLFIPLGLGLRLAGWRWRTAVAAGAMLSLTVETLQFSVVAGRDASLSDLLTNTAGTAIGAAAAGVLVALVRPGPALAKRLLAGAVVVWLGLLGLSAWLLQPGARDGRLTSNWAHRAPGADDFHGEVTSVLLNRVPMPPHATLPDSAGFRARFRRGDATLEVALVSGPTPAFRSWVFRVSVGPRAGIPQLVLSQQRRSAVLGVPARGLRFRLVPPTLSLPEGFPQDPGVPVQIRGGRERHRLWLETAYAGQRRAAELELSPAHGWVLVAPFSLALGPGSRWITASLVLVLTLPLGYWGAAAGRRAAGATVAAALGAGLGVVPVLGGYAPVHWSEWLAAVVAVAAGWALHRFAAYLQRRCGSPSISESSSS